MTNVQQKQVKECNENKKKRKQKNKKKQNKLKNI